jgi:hypothetical protein
MSRTTEKQHGGYEYLVCDERRHGIELIEFHGMAGYEDERLILENGLSNGLRFLVMDHDCWAHFNIISPETARLIAKRLNDYAERIADPPDIGGDVGHVLRGANLKARK